MKMQRQHESFVEMTVPECTSSVKKKKRLTELQMIQNEKNHPL